MEEQMVWMSNLVLIFAGATQQRDPDAAGLVKAIHREIPFLMLFTIPAAFQSVSATCMKIKRKFGIISGTSIILMQNGSDLNWLCKQGIGSTWMAIIISSLDAKGKNSHSAIEGTMWKRSLRTSPVALQRKMPRGSPGGHVTYSSVSIGADWPSVTAWGKTQWPIVIVRGTISYYSTWTFTFFQVPILECLLSRKNR